MVSYNEYDSSDSGRNLRIARNPNTSGEMPNAPPGIINHAIPHTHSGTGKAKWGKGIIIHFIKSILSISKSKIVYKKIIADDLNLPFIRSLSADNIEVVASFLNIAKNSREYRNIGDRFAEGCECYAIIEKSMLALTWVYRNKYRIGSGSKMLGMKPDEALIAETVLGESIDDWKAIMLEDGVALLLKQRGIKPLVFASSGTADISVYSINQIRFLGLTLTMTRANPAHAPLGFR